MVFFPENCFSCSSLKGIFRIVTHQWSITIALFKLHLPWFDRFSPKDINVISLIIIIIIIIFWPTDDQCRCLEEEWLALVTEKDRNLRQQIEKVQPWRVVYTRAKKKQTVALLDLNGAVILPHLFVIIFMSKRNEIIWSNRFFYVAWCSNILWKPSTLFLI